MFTRRNVFIYIHILVLHKTLQLDSPQI